MNVKRKVVVSAAAALAVGGGGVGVAGAVSGDDGDKQVTGPAADRAKAAAIRLIPGGTATAVERDSEKGATWEVEVRKANGSSVDVRLGSDLQKVAIDADSESADAGR